MENKKNKNSDLVEYSAEYVEEHIQFIIRTEGRKRAEKFKRAISLMGSMEAENCIYEKLVQNIGVLAGNNERYEMYWFINHFRLMDMISVAEKTELYKIIDKA